MVTEIQGPDGLLWTGFDPGGEVGRGQVPKMISSSFRPCLVGQVSKTTPRPFSSGHWAHSLLSIKAKGQEFSGHIGELGSRRGGATMPFERPPQGEY